MGEVVAAIAIRKEAEPSKALPHSAVRGRAGARLARTADVVILLLNDGKPVLVIIVEVQLKKDDDKPFAWPCYLANGRQQHRCPANLLVVAPVLPAIAGLDEERARFYYDLVYNSLNEAARRALEEMMKGYEYQSDFAKKYVAQGRAEARASDVLTVLRARRVAVPDAARDRILAEKDPAQLERWLERASVATSIAEMFSDPSQAA